eukprot:CAMPEP_0202963856 /NCGR_PEP_ID=MMETSP1396-20130829/7891_1 /ASSEMBLY_ACC=CAM_ASM_000872 /TAXON_ID= /ORGANISM="Pseudokeronopsis sp., Strain Brazil" /LENGTH=122 /DNA_ID=CAMNT_0049685443 /DNA_START=221 /DNA_END=586 /DNA_ORIENTATION=-
MALGLVRLISQYQHDDSMENEMNMSNSYALFVRKCGFLDTLPGTLLLNALYGELAFLQGKGKIKTPIPQYLVRIVDMVTWFQDVSEFFTATDIFKYHHDLYNVGIALGKLIKVMTQLVLYGW